MAEWSPGLDRLGRAGRGRLAPPAGRQRAVQQAVLGYFAATGGPPQPAALAGAAGGADPAEVLAALRAADFLRLDEAGQIQAAYPFSAVPTRHRVQIAGARWCMRCAPSTRWASRRCFPPRW